MISGLVVLLVMFLLYIPIIITTFRLLSNDYGSNRQRTWEKLFHAYGWLLTIVALINMILALLCID